MSNATYDLGRVGLNLCGEYSPTTAYEPLDVVTWRGGSFAARDAANNVQPSDAATWQPLAQGTAPFTTDEAFTGQYWLDGRSIYSKTLLIGPKTVNARPVATGVPDLYQMLDMHGVMYAMADYSGYAFVTPAAKTNQDWQIGFEYNKNTNAVIVEATSRTYATGFVTIKYTKTGDAPTRYHLPFLTANSDQGCIASASSEFNGGNQRAWNGFSGDMQTEWCSTTADTDRWLQIQMPYALRNMAVTLVDRKDVAATPARALTAGSFQGSNNGVSWTTLASFTGRNPNHESHYTTRHALGNATAYKYLRFVPDPGTYTTALGTGVADLRVEGEIASW